MDKATKHYVELLEAGEDAPETLESAEQAFDLVAALVDCLAVVPGGDPRAERWDDRGKPEVEGQLPGLVSLIGPIHDQVNLPVRATECGKKLSSLGGVVRLPGREGKRYGRSSIRGNQMNLGVPSAAGLADGLRAVFFSAPVPSGCTLMLVESSDTASILMRTI